MPDYKPISLVLILLGLFGSSISILLGFIWVPGINPESVQQGSAESYRILFWHVSFAWCSFCVHSLVILLSFCVYWALIRPLIRLSYSALSHLIRHSFGAYTGRSFGAHSVHAALILHAFCVHSAIILRLFCAHSACICYHSPIIWH